MQAGVGKPTRPSGQVVEVRHRDIESAALASLVLGGGLIGGRSPRRSAPVKRLRKRPIRGDARDPKRKKTTRAWRKWTRRKYR